MVNNQTWNLKLTPGGPLGPGSPGSDMNVSVGSSSSPDPSSGGWGTNLSRSVNSRYSRGDKPS